MLYIQLYEEGPIILQMEMRMGQSHLKSLRKYWIRWLKTIEDEGGLVDQGLTRQLSLSTRKTLL